MAHSNLLLLAIAFATLVTPLTFKEPKQPVTCSVSVVSVALGAATVRLTN